MYQWLEQYYKRKARGVCGQCGKRPPIDGMVWCEECQKKHAKWQSERRDRYEAEGRCRDCGKKLRETETYKTCFECRLRKHELRLIRKGEKTY